MDFIVLYNVCVLHLTLLCIYSSLFHALVFTTTIRLRCHDFKVTVDEVRIDNRLIELLGLVTTSNDYAVTVVHISQIILEHSRSPQSVTVFTSRCLVAAFNGVLSPSSGFPNCSRPQLPGSHSNSSQRLNPSSYLTSPLLIKSFD
jgi:hypothetical protein